MNPGSHNVVTFPKPHLRLSSNVVRQIHNDTNPHILRRNHPIRKAIRHARRFWAGVDQEARRLLAYFAIVFAALVGLLGSLR